MLEPIISAIIDGTVKEVTYQDTSMLILCSVGTVIGTVLILLGVMFLVFKKNEQVSDIGFKGFKAKNVTQGVVLAIVGAIVAVVSISFFPTKKTETEITGSSIIIEKNADSSVKMAD